VSWDGRLELPTSLPVRNCHLKSWESSDETSWKLVQGQKTDMVIPIADETSEIPQNMLVGCIRVQGKAPLRVSQQTNHIGLKKFHEFKYPKAG